MKKPSLYRIIGFIISSALLLCASVLPIQATLTTWDPQGTSGANPYTGDLSGVWENANWSTSQTGQTTPQNWVENTAAIFGVHTGIGTPAFTVTMNANHTVAGIFDGQQTPNSCTVTVTGTGQMILPSGAQGFYLIKASDNSIANVTVNNVIAGTGQIAAQGGSSGVCNITLNGNNTFSGGVMLGFQANSWGGLINYGHNNAFGTGSITISNNAGSAFVPVGTGAYTIPNNFVLTQIGSTSMNFVGNAGGITYSGNWNLGANSMGMGTSGGTSVVTTMSGNISGTGGLFRQQSTTHGTIVLSGNNTYSGKTTVDSSVTSVSSINSVTTPTQQSSSNLGKPSNAANGTIGLGSATFTGTLKYTGAGETTDRVIDLQGTTGGGTLDQSGTGLLKFTSATTGTGNGPKTFTLQGSTAGTGELSSTIPDCVSGSTVTTASAVLGATSLTLASVSGIVNGAAVSGTGIAASTTVTAVNTSTKVITLSAGTTAAISSGATVTVAGVKNLTSVTKAGTGTWTLSHANTYTGGTTLTAGTLNIGVSGALSSGTITLNGGSFDNLTGGDLTLANSVSLANSSTYVGSANSMIFNGATTLTASKTLTVTAQTVTLHGGVSGAFTLTKAGAGTLVLDTANTHSATTLSAGNLNLGNAGALGSGTFAWNGGTVDNISGGDLAPANALVTLGGTVTYAGSANNLTFSTGQLTGNRTVNVTANTLSFGSIIENGAARNLTKGGSGTLLLTGASTNTGSTTVSAGTLKIGSAGTLGSGSYAAAVSVTGTFDYNSTANQLLSGVVSGAGSIVQDGPGELTLGGSANTFSGTITINSGGLSNGVANALPANATINLNGGTLDMGANNATIKAIQYAGLTKGAGTYGRIGSGAMHETAQITGDGILTVTGGGVTTTTVTSDGASVTPGTLVTFTVTVTGSGGDATVPDGSITLYDNGVAVTTLSLTPTTGTSAAATYQTSTLSVGTHPMTASWPGNTSYGASTSSTYNETVVNAPVFASPTSPQVATVDAGTTNVFTVSLTDPTGVTYQWKKGGANVSNGTFNNAATVIGSTTATLSLVSVRAADASPGDYTCVASNAAGTQTSTTFTLNVNDPVITTQPTNSTFSCGTTGSLSVKAIGTTNANGSLAYQWYTPNPAGTAIANATNSALVFSPSSFAVGGSYSVVVSNALGNSITSSVAVVTIVDTNAPALVGVPAAQTILCSDPVPAWPTVTATDTCDPSPTVTSNAVINPGNCPQNYTIVRTWIGQDSSGNSVTNSQSITVKDTNAPVITLTNGAVFVECHTAYVEPGYSAADACAGSATFTVTSSPALDTNTVGTYTLTYVATDPCNNAATNYRVVTVRDQTPPSVSLLGTNLLTIQCHSVYTDPGFTASDTCSASLTTNVIGTVNTNVLGDYPLTYTAVDASLNSNGVVRVVHVVDTTAPDITVLGTSPMTVECHDAFVDPGATASDTCAGTTAVTTNNPVNANQVGTYTVTYTSGDGNGNTNSAHLVVHVIDTTAPSITVTPSADTVCLGSGTYVDPGATASDICGSATLTTNATAVNTSAIGTYTVTYVATDNSNNSATNTRTVQVVQCATPVAFTGNILTSGLTVKIPDGTNVNFSVGTSGTDPKTYKWYVKDFGVPGDGTLVATTFTSNAVISAKAVNRALVTATNVYYVIVDNVVNSPQSNGFAVVSITVDSKPPSVVIALPKKSHAYNAAGFSISGTASDKSKGNIASVHYKYINQNFVTPVESDVFTAVITEKVPGNELNKIFNITTNPPPLPGTNTLVMWTDDLGGNTTSNAPTTVQFFYEVPISFALTRAGDGSGTVKYKGVWKDSATVPFSTNPTNSSVMLNVGEVYTFTFTPDKKANTVTGTAVSVLTNAPPAWGNTNYSKKYLYTTQVQSNMNSLFFQFDRDRFVDMAGKYNAVFTANTNSPTTASSGYLNLGVTSKRIGSGALTMGTAAKTSFAGVTFDASGHTHFSVGSITIDGTLAWAGSENTGPKQFLGTATDGNWTANIIADLADKTFITASANATMEIPPVANGPAGTGHAAITAAGGNVKAIYTLADDDKHPLTWGLFGSRSGNVPQYIVTKTGSLLLGTLHVSADAQTVSATGLTWIGANPNAIYNTLNAGGFTASPFDAVCSPFAIANKTFSGSYHLTLDGGGVVSNVVNQAVTFASGVLTPVGPIKSGAVDGSGNIKIVFQDGRLIGKTKLTSTALGTWLPNATSGAGFFILSTGPTNSGTMTLSP